MKEDTQENGLHTSPKIVYYPVYQETQQEQFKKFVEKEYQIKLNNYFDLHEWSYKNYPEFWDCVWRFFDVVHSEPYTEVYNRNNGFKSMEWFKGARLNCAQNILKYRDSKTAIISTDAEDNTEYISYEELYQEVRVYVEAMKNEGVKKGDYVACYMSNKKEAVIAFLATATIGAIWTGVLPLLGTKSVLSRLEQTKPKILFTAGNFKFDNVEIKPEQNLREIVLGTPSIKKVIFCPKKSKDVTEDISAIPKCVYISEFLHESREMLRNNDSELEFEQLPFDYPLCISFTSGTTGAPKVLVHSTGSFFSTLKDVGLLHNCRRGDILFNQSPGGWVSWNMHASSLHLGLTVVMYDGDVFEESPTRFWDLVDKFGITSTYIWSSTVENMEINGSGPTPKHTLKTLRQLFPMGSPCKGSSFDFLSEKVKPGLFFSSGYGCTEVFGLISGLNSNMPVYKGELQAISLGMDIRILDEKDNPVVGKRGEVVLANPYPGLPVRLLNDEDKEKFTELYLSQHTGYWNIGDDAWQNPVTKGLIVFGRSDDTMNPKGARFNCGEIYFALERFRGMMDSVCVSQYNNEMDERVILFVKMFPDRPLTPEVEDEIRKTIEHHLTYEHVPEIIMEAPDIPYNLTGKKLNGLVKKLVNKKPVLNADVVVNPSSVEFFKNLNLGDF